ncbi:MAG: hypothetical protein GY865_12150, partial [candidate division Zixibacteria bacterium]|nr:hypothetical protein [candidate division Zixibacteria bacterium]
MIKVIYSLLILAILLVFPMNSFAINESSPDRDKIYNKPINKPFSDNYPVFLTKLLPPDVSKYNQLSEITGFSDVLISESVAPATFTQQNSTTTRLADGRTVVGWTDDRNGNLMIFIQIFDSDGIRSGSNIMAIGRDDQNDVSSPQLVSDGSGGFYLGWRDDATGWIFASHFYGDLTRETEFRISNPALGYAGLFDMALY